MKLRIVIILLVTQFLHTYCAHSQPSNPSRSKIIEISVCGEGYNRENAVFAAEQNAIEQAMSSFVSSNTSILNDPGVRDAVISPANANIVNYKVLSEIRLPDSSSAVVIKIWISIPNLINFCEKEGILSDFPNALSIFDSKQHVFNEQNEIRAVERVCHVLKSASDQTFDYTLKTKEQSDGSSLIEISVFANKNYKAIEDYLLSSLEGLSESTEEIESTEGPHSIYYKVLIAGSDRAAPLSVYNFRNLESLAFLTDFLAHFRESVMSFEITGDSDTINGLNLLHQAYSSTWVNGCQLSYFDSTRSSYGLRFPDPGNHLNLFSIGVLREPNCLFSSDFKWSFSEMSSECLITTFYETIDLRGRFHCSGSGGRPNIITGGLPRFYDFLKGMDLEIVRKYDFIASMQCLAPEVKDHVLQILIKTNPSKLNNNRELSIKPIYRTQF